MSDFEEGEQTPSTDVRLLARILTLMAEVQDISRNLADVLEWIRRLERDHPELFTPDDGK